MEKTLNQSKNSEWKEIQKNITKFSSFDLSYADSSDKENYNSLLAKLTTLRDEKSKEFALPTNLVSVVDDIEKTLKHKYNQPQQIKKFRGLWEKNLKSAPQSTALNTLKLRFDKAISELTDKVEASGKQRDEAAKQAIADINKVSKLIKDGHLADAKIGINKIAENKKIAGQHKLIQDNKFALDNLWNELKELRKWQKWSNDEIRLRMINDLKSLVGTGTHPDTLLKKMKEANKTWKDLEDSEKLEGDKFGVRNMEQWVQFREVQKALFEPAQPYFEKRSEIWSQELEHLEADIKELKTIDLIATEDRDLARLVRDSIKKLRSLDKVPPNKRGACASGLRAGIKRLDEHLSESYEVASRRKEKLIESAQEFLELEDLDAAIEGAKSLQADWKKAGIVNQAQERKLWKKFRKINDAIFNRLKQKRQDAKNESNELFETAKTLISETQTKIEQTTSSQSIHSLVENFRSQFNELNIQSKGIENQARTLIQFAQTQIQKSSIQESLESLKALADKAKLCQEIEQGILEASEAEEKWSELPQVSETKLEKQIQKRFNSALKNKQNDEFVESATQFLIASEYLTGNATPEEDKELRLNYQVEVLSKRMSGEESLSVSEQASSLLKQWYLLDGSQEEFLKKNQSRIENVIQQLYELMANS